MTSVPELAAAVRAGRTSAAATVRAALSRARAVDAAPEGLNAFLSLDDGAAAHAALVDEQVATGREPGPLAGVPIAIKDNIATLGTPTTCASRMLENYRAPYEATAVRRLRAAGAVVIGKTNLDEFAMGSSTEHSAFGPTRNPHDRTRVPGGSSGGSAAAVAAGVVPAALGSETGGSVRQPAAFCGVVGVKPTYGRVSRYGLVAFASSLDQIGTFGRTVADAATLLEVIAGPDPFDATAAGLALPPLLPELERDVHGLVIGVPDEYFPAWLDPAVAQLVRSASARLQEAGATVRPVSLPTTRLAIPAYCVIAPAEASSNLARFDGVRYGLRQQGDGSTTGLYEASRSAGFGAEVKRRIMLGTFALSAGYYDRYYAQAQQVRAALAAELRTLFHGGVHALLTPTTPSVAFEFGARSDPYAMYLEDIFTVTANLAGIPAVSVPVGHVGGLPVGAQILADRWGEPVMLRVAAALERALA
jgi:aspartyl-tRNA(Asn)/glutamyl-tRNA(Gln) amidotransferase subunit A